MPYVAKQKSNNRNKIIITVIVAALLTVVATWFFFFRGTSSTKDIKKSNLKICGMSETKTSDVLEKNYKDTYKTSDYLFYGDSLAIFTKRYDGENDDKISGKTIVLKNVCSDKRESFVIESNVDRNILLNKLEEGFYEVYVLEDLVEKRVEYEGSIDTSIYVSSSKDNYNKVRLMTTDKLISDSKNNYLFIEVKKSKQKKDYYDIALDPAGYATGSDGKNSLGSKGNGLVEAKESYQACVKIKKYLEAEGFKVIILRKDKEQREYYGDGGRFDIAYSSQARYYFHIGFSESEFDTASGLEIGYSSHASSVLANQIVYDLGKNTKLKASEVYSDDRGKDGLIQAMQVEGSDQKKIYDDDPFIRESGGKATLAGMYSDMAKQYNGDFAAGNEKGMQCLNVAFLYFTNNNDAKLWESDNTKICKHFAKSVSEYIHGED